MAAVEEYVALFFLLCFSILTPPFLLPVPMCFVSLALHVPFHDFDFSSALKANLQVAALI
jgi:hypothetical protein